MYIYHGTNEEARKERKSPIWPFLLGGVRFSSRGVREGGERRGSRS